DRPFPDVADHVAEPVAVRWKCRDRGRAFVAVDRSILMREFALPGVGAMFAVRRELIAPSVFRTVEPAACGELPFGLGGQFLAGPGGIGLRITISDVNYGMIVEPADVTARAIWPTPVCAEFESPPLRPVGEVNSVFRGRKNQRAGFEHVRKRARIV